ncbi:hypothetical protein NXC24_CH00714 [Rhizobium sp. NXC24]|nr:hypothetical protein NXC24_CH00714 [Rhizobium sp. NXC24]
MARTSQASSSGVHILGRQAIVQSGRVFVRRTTKKRQRIALPWKFMLPNEARVGQLHVSGTFRLQAAQSSNERPQVGFYL